MCAEQNRTRKCRCYSDSRTTGSNASTASQAAATTTVSTKQATMQEQKQNRKCYALVSACGDQPRTAVYLRPQVHLSRVSPRSRALFGLRNKQVCLVCVSTPARAVAAAPTPHPRSRQWLPGACVLHVIHRPGSSFVHALLRCHPNPQPWAPMTACCRRPSST